MTLLNPEFAKAIEELPAALERLLACNAQSGMTALSKAVPARGVYLFSEGSEHLYVGRTNRLRTRHREHRAGRNNDAPFAFKLARRRTGNVAKGGLTRSQLEVDETFASAFAVAKSEVSRMDFRWVEESDPVRQCLLEIYVSIALATPYNDFENH